MSYQVLARKWRPRTFREMVGQEHVLQALINALDHDRLHHAYLFTGTRGVGKTTIGRILAKCLNCEVGVSSSPCNECPACVEINEGRFVDLIEVDAASRTKVEDTRELLENVQYAPTRGRYKVYLIDEVHMLSNSSFNALLKTLEEPPPHVKFLLATTDPQKLPVTILSRCLQFNLKNMNPERIVSHLQFILEKEMVPFEEAALWQLARSADGSMRDALSLTDQSIAFGDGKVTDADVRTMLGTIDQSLVYQVVAALIAEDGQALLKAVEHLSEHAPDYSAALAEMINLFHRIAIAQALPEAVDNSQGDRQQIYDFAGQISAEDLQLYYQTALLGRRDLPLVPDPRSGFEMVLLRMLAFKPQGVTQLPTKAIQAAQPSSATTEMPTESAQPGPVPQQQNVEPSVETSTDSDNYPEISAATPVGEEAPDSVKKPELTPVPASAEVLLAEPAGAYDGETHVEEAHSGMASAQVNHGSQENLSESSSHNVIHEPEPIDHGMAPEVAPQVSPKVVPTAHVNSPSEGALDDSATIASEHEDMPAESAPVPSVSEILASASVDSPVAEVPVAERHIEQAVSDELPSVEAEVSFAEFSAEHWITVYLAINPGGLLQSTAANCALVSKQGRQLHFLLDEQQSTLYDEAHQQRLAELLSHYFQQEVDVVIQVGEVSSDTPAQIIIRRQQLRQQQAESAIHGDPVVEQLQQLFGASVIEDSIKPIDG